jgi:hypothetical protein
VLSADIKRLKRTIFDHSNSSINKGETILRSLNINPEAELRAKNFLSNEQMKFIRDIFRPETVLGTCLKDPLDYLMSSEYVLVSETINRFLPCFNKDSFTFKKSYKIVEAINPKETWGKFSGVLNNFVLTDKHYLVGDVIEMIHRKLNDVYTEH